MDIVIAELMKKYWIIGSIAAGLIIAPASYFLIQYKRLMDYKIEPNSITRISTDGNILTYRIVFDFTNQSSLTYTIEKQSYGVFLRGIKIAEGEHESSTVISGNSVNKLPVIIRIPQPTVLQGIGMALDVIGGAEIVVNVKWQVSLLGIKTNIKESMNFKL